MASECSDKKNHKVFSVIAVGLFKFIARERAGDRATRKLP